MQVVRNFLAIFLVLPIWFWLMYQILVRVDASELMWFLYWIYVPASLASAVLTKLLEADGKK